MSFESLVERKTRAITRTEKSVSLALFIPVINYVNFLNSLKAFGEKN